MDFKAEKRPTSMRWVIVVATKKKKSEYTTAAARQTAQSGGSFIHDMRPEPGDSTIEPPKPAKRLAQTCGPSLPLMTSL